MPEKQDRKKKPPKKVTAQWLHNAGLYYLQRFACSSGHFRKVMMRKIDRSCQHHKEQDRAACAAMLEDTITTFLRAGILDDSAYARAAAASFRRRGFSARSIAARLSARCLEPQQVEDALSQYDEEHSRDEGSGDLIAAIRIARKKKIGPFANVEKEDSSGKALAALARGGFSYDTALAALKIDRDEAERILASQ